MAKSNHSTALPIAAPVTTFRRVDAPTVAGAAARLTLSSEGMAVLPEIEVALSVVIAALSGDSKV